MRNSKLNLLQNCNKLYIDIYIFGFLTILRKCGKI